MDYIEINGYKSIKKAKVKLGPINILIGANGSGKSNFLSFFEFLNHLHEGKLREYISLGGGEDKMLHKGGENTQEISFETEFDEGVNGYSAVLKKGDDKFIFTEEYLIYNGSKGRSIADFGSEAQIKKMDSDRAKYVLWNLNSFKKHHFHHTGRNSPFNKLSHIDNGANFFYEKGDNIAAFLFRIKELNKIYYNRILKTIQSIAPFFSDFYFQPNEEGYVRLQWQDKYSSTVYGATDLSDGTIRFIALTTLFLQPDLPSTIIIDEPELGAAPFCHFQIGGHDPKRCGKGYTGDRGHSIGRFN